MGLSVTETFNILMKQKRKRFQIFNRGFWSPHTFFAYDLVSNIKPEIIVELGTFRGESFFSMCEAVRDNNLSTTCYAVDTWGGDPQQGMYDESVYLDVSNHAEKEFKSFAHLLRTDFSEAAKQFKSESIDLLHIDGYHTYDAVKSDFDTWYEKLKPGCVILFHDTKIRKNDFGVHKFWSELSGPKFEFRQGCGLGVFVKGSPVGNEFLETLLSGEPMSNLAFENYYESRYETENLKSLLAQEKENLQNLKTELLSSQELNRSYSSRVVSLKWLIKRLVSECLRRVGVK